MPEAITAFITMLFSQGIQGITVRVFEANEMSIKMIEKLGFTREGRLVNAVRSSFGQIQNDILFYLSDKL